LYDALNGVGFGGLGGLDLGGISVSLPALQDIGGKSGVVPDITYNIYYFRIL